MAETHDTPRFKLEWGTKKGVRLTRDSIDMLFVRGYYFCYKCSEVKPVDQFNRRYGTQTDYPRSECKSCERNRKRTSGSEHRRYQRRRQYFQDWDKRRRARRQALRNETSPLQKKARRAICVQQSRKARKPTTDGGGFIYVLHMSGVYKIGKTTNLKHRVANIAGFMPLPTELIHTITVESGLSSAETWVHDRFVHCRLNGEWFRLSDTDLSLLTAITNL